MEAIFLKKVRKEAEASGRDPEGHREPAGSEWRDFHSRPIIYQLEQEGDFVVLLVLVSVCLRCEVVRSA